MHFSSMGMFHRMWLFMSMLSNKVKFEIDINIDELLGAVENENENIIQFEY